MTSNDAFSQFRTHDLSVILPLSYNLATETIDDTKMEEIILQTVHQKQANSAVKSKRLQKESNLYKTKKSNDSRHHNSQGSIDGISEWQKPPISTYLKSKCRVKTSWRKRKAILIVEIPKNWKSPHKSGHLPLPVMKIKSITSHSFCPEQQRTHRATRVPRFGFGSILALPAWLCKSRKEL